MSAPPLRPPLAPTPSMHLNARASSGPTSNKRKRNDSSEIPSEYVPFAARAVSLDDSHQSATFAPITTITRGQLPLAVLDYSPSPGVLPSGYLFRCRVPALEAAEGRVLVARLLPNGGLYAIEKAGSTVFVACALQTWATEAWFRDAEVGVSMLSIDENVINKEHIHSRSVSISSKATPRPPTPNSPRRPKNRKGALARMSILTPRETPGTENVEMRTTMSALTESPACGPTILDAVFTLPITPGASDELTELDALSAEKDEVGMGESIEPLAPDYGNVSKATKSGTLLDISSPLGTLDQLHSQYLETLYMSRTSLAFYAKGPLSRARAQAKQGNEGFSLEELKSFYQSAVLPLKKMDTKYKTTIQEIIRAQVAAAGSGHQKRSKRKAASIFKLGKGGLYPDEHDMITGHWTERELEPTSASNVDSFAQDVTHMVTKLRSRETEMQILLLLEIKILESLCEKAAKIALSSTEKVIKDEIEEEDATAILTKTPQKNPKPRDCDAELESLVDRLCIWHSVAIDQLVPSPEKLDHADDQASTKSKDKLREFCADVIVPFYSTRVPVQSRLICRKLGGPDFAAQRPRPPSSSSRQHPMAAPKKQRPKMTTKRSLQRVLSEDMSVQHRPPPVLSRSATAPLVPNLKREPSEVSTRPMSRTGMQKSVSFMNREIDLESDARTQDAKKRKLDMVAQQKKELREAIDALKKPNRTSAASLFMDEIESRSVDARTGLKKMDTPVQITATPKRSSARHTSHSEPELPLMPRMIAREELSAIPSSTSKPPQISSVHEPLTSAKKRAVPSAIQDTPSRGSARTSDPLSLREPMLVAATPAGNRFRPALPVETPLKVMTRSGRPVLFTPIKRNDVSMDDAFRDAPEIPADAGKAMDRVMGGKGVELRVGHDSGELNIYQALGWDDDDDL